MRRQLFGANISREGWDALWDGDPPPIADAQLELENIVERMRRQGRLVAELARDQETADELNKDLGDSIRRLPMSLNAAIYGPVASSIDAIMRDLVELLGIHRNAILRVTDEQVVDPEAIERILAGAPVPGRDVEDLASRIGAAIGAHSQALILIATDFDEWVASQ